MSDKVTVGRIEFSFDKSKPGTDTGRIHREPLLKEVDELRRDLAATQLKLAKAAVLLGAYRELGVARLAAIDPLSKTVGIARARVAELEGEQ